MSPKNVSSLSPALRGWGLLLGAVVSQGCARERFDLKGHLANRIKTESNAVAGNIPNLAVRPAASDSMLVRTAAAQDGDPPTATPERPDETALPPALVEGVSVGTMGGGRDAASPDEAELDAIIASGQPLDLPGAIVLAFRHQPKLRAQMESIAQARSRKEIVASTFLPIAGGAYSFGGFDLNAGGNPIRLGGSSAAFNFIPGLGAVPAGLQIATGYELAEFKVHWLVYDFGRRLGRYEQARLALDVAGLQTDRAHQTVANEVSVAYYGVLRGQALHRSAQDASRRAEEELADARKLEREGVVTHESVLRAEVLRAEVKQQLHVAIESEFVALAELNLAMGLKCGEPVRVLEPPELPPFEGSLADCLEIATRERREFRVAQRTVEIAHEGSRVAKAEFAPKVVSEGALLDLRQSSPTGSFDLALGFIRLEWNIFEGGRRVAETRVADSRVREAMALAESIADNIAFQVNESYRRLTTARVGIDDARPAVEQARENLRLVRLRTHEGNATPTELTDAQATLTRAEQNYLNAQYAYLTATARLAYAMGNTPTPSTPEPRDP